MSKVTVVGAGNVGATCANVLVTTQVADEVVLLDIKEGVSEGKAMDIMQTANILGINSRLIGVTNDYAMTENSDVVVITSGIPRKPGMTREELIGVNAGIVKSVTENVLKHSPNAIIVCVSNPSWWSRLSVDLRSKTQNSKKEEMPTTNHKRKNDSYDSPQSNEPI